MKKRLLVVFLLLAVFLVDYCLVDNYRILVTKETVHIKNLPMEWEGFTILQITDLHSRSFGGKQQDLLRKINQCHYDMIAITGDMVNQEVGPEAFYKLLDGIENRKHVLFVPGNADPAVAVYTPSADMSEKTSFTKQFEKTTFAKELENRECTILDSSQASYALRKRKHTLWVENFREQPQMTSDPTDLRIGLSHYPITQEDAEGWKAQWESARQDVPDLILAGHYHGGQLRVPFFGALYVPASSMKNRGYFPPQQQVKGLMEFQGIRQYISTGLGANGWIPLLKFRLFNPPEINLITLTGKP